MNTSTKYPKGTWLRHTEPGQEDFLIRVEDPEKSICSGWDCKAHFFINHKVFIGERIVPITGDTKHMDYLFEEELLHQKNK